MNNLTTIGIDLAKNSFSVHGVDAMGKRVFRKKPQKTLENLSGSHLVF